MGKQIFFLFIFCAALSQGAGILSEDNAISITFAEDFHVRKKRLIAQTSDGNKPVRIEQVPYIVNILMNGLSVCGGSILSQLVIITAAHCFEDHTGKYSILSGSPYVDRGTHHSIERLLIYPDFHPKKYASDLALCTILPPIDFSRSPNRRILLYNGLIPPNTLGTVSGWGAVGTGWSTYCICGMVFPKKLRSTTIPTISEEQCKWDMNKDPEITDKVICAFDRIQGKRCGPGDSGGPLVVNNQLAGIMSWSAENEGPEVFMNLSHPDYRKWIIYNMEHAILPIRILQTQPGHEFTC